MIRDVISSSAHGIRLTESDPKNGSGRRVSN